MSQIAELIEKLCPDGVVFARIGELAHVGTGSSDRQDAELDGQFPFYVRSRDVLSINRYEFDEKAIVIPGEGGVGEIFHYVDGKYALHQRAYRISFHDDRVNTRFAYFYYEAHFKEFILAKALSATVTSIRKPMLTDFTIPVPPMEVQREIVRILDAMTSLQAELQAELQARRSQFEFYRNSLLSCTANDANTQWVTLGQVVTILDSQRRPISKDKREPGGIPYYGANGIQGYVRDYIFDGTFLLVGEDGSVINPDRSPILNWATGKIWVNNHAHILGELPDVALLRYVYFFLQTSDVSSIVRGTPPKINQASLRAIPIALPSMSEQNRLVEILNKFEALSYDISFGLPAEIEARRKQYEYYRDKLLTFDEAN